MATAKQEKALMRHGSIRSIKVEEVEEEDEDDIQVPLDTPEKGQVILRQLFSILALNKKASLKKRNTKDTKETKDTKKKDTIKEPPSSKKKGGSSSKRGNTLPLSPRKELTPEEREKKIRDAVSLFAGTGSIDFGTMPSPKTQREGSAPSISVQKKETQGPPVVGGIPLTGFKINSNKPPSIGKTKQSPANRSAENNLMAMFQPPSAPPSAPSSLTSSSDEGESPQEEAKSHDSPDTSRSGDDEKPLKGMVFKGKTIDVIEQLGKGATATVYRACIDDRIVALKTVELGNVKDKIAMRRVLAAEVDMMKQFRHPNVIRYYGQFYSKKEQEMQIILEYVDGGSIEKLLQTVKKFSESLSARILFQCLQGLAFLHEHCIIHRDFKPDNMLISRATGKIKLIDFGAATKVLEIRTMRRSTVGTPWYTAPEIINGEEYEFSADIWSLGCTLIHFVSGAPPFAEDNAVAALFKMAEHNPPIPEGISPECAEFFDACIQREPKKRKSAVELLETAFIKKHVTNPQDENLLCLFENDSVST